MNKFKNSFLCKSLAALLSLLIIISAMPFMVMSAFAATEEIADYVTITVTDEDGSALEGATVEFVLNSKTNGDGYIQKEEKTDKSGCVKVLPSEEYIEDDLTITATISKEKYQTDTSVNEFEIIDSKQDIVTVDRGDNYNQFSKTVETEIALGKIDLGGLTVTGLDSVYTGDKQEVVEVKGKGDYNLQYKLDGIDVDFGDNIPTVTDAGSYTVYVRAVKDNYNEEKVDVIASERIYPFNVYVAKKGQSITFNDANYEDGQATSIDLDTAKGKTFNFSADGGVVDADIVYSIENASDDGLAVDEIAEIDSKKGIQFRLII